MPKGKKRQQQQPTQAKPKPDTEKPGKPTENQNPPQTKPKPDTEKPGPSKPDPKTQKPPENPPKKPLPKTQKLEYQRSESDSDASENSSDSENQPNAKNAFAALQTDDKASSSSSSEVEVDKVKLERNLRKQLRAGKITREEFEKAMGTYEEPKEQGTEEDQRQQLKSQEYTSGLVGLVEKKRVDVTSKDIKVEGFTLAYKSMILLKDANLTITNGRKYGIIGPNGTGKSTLLRHISQRHLPIPEGINILHVEQEIEGTDQIALDAVIEADVERLSLLKELDQLTPLAEENTEEGMHAQERTIEIYKRLRAIGAHTAVARASAILSGLQFTTEMQQKKTKEFSGGWRMRIALARALFVLPDLLLLDEPTNHLDLDAVIWLEAYLKKYKKTLVLVSHDRDFINGIITDIICVINQQLVYYKGNYDSYEKGELQKKKQKEKEIKIKNKKIAEANVKQTKDARNKKKKILEGGKVEKMAKDYSVQFIFRDPGPLGYPVIQIRNVSFGYKPDKLPFKDLELNVDMESRIAIVGPNGAGKSTLMNLILGELEPTKGTIERNRHLRVAKFSQHFVDQLNMVETPVQYIAKKFPEFKEQEVRNKLGMYNLKGNLHNQPISLLSGGQKSRVAMAEIALKNPHIFFLDEPTNHLDIQTVDALSKALQEFKGGVILITHDQRLVTTVANELWVCRGDGSVEIFEGSFEDYKQTIVDNMPDELFLVSDDEN